jgi:hypothetical protein
MDVLQNSMDHWIDMILECDKNVEIVLVDEASTFLKGSYWNDF